MTLPHWLGGKLSRDYGDAYLTAQQRWQCFACGREAPFSWWRCFTGRG